MKKIDQAADAVHVAANRDFGTDAIWAVREDMAAAFRSAAAMGFQDGVCNHFSAMVPGYDDCFIVNALGAAFAEITAGGLLICDFDGNVLSGRGEPEATAFFIHARVHRAIPRARALFHAHCPNMTALASIAGDPFSWTTQGSLLFYRRLAVLDEYDGLAFDESEGDRIAAGIGDADIVFLRNHGVIVCSENVAEAWDDLYFLERAAELEIKALSCGRPLNPIPQAVAQKAYDQLRPTRPEAAAAHLRSIKRRLVHDHSDFADRAPERSPTRSSP